MSSITKIKSLLHWLGPGLKKVKLPASKAGLHFFLRGKAIQNQKNDFYLLWGLKGAKPL
jgi:hypothetical protein